MASEPADPRTDSRVTLLPLGERLLNALWVAGLVLVIACVLLVAALAADGLWGTVDWRDLTVLLVYPLMAALLCAASVVVSGLAEEARDCLEPSWRRGIVDGGQSRLSWGSWLAVFIAAVALDAFLEGVLPRERGWLWTYGLLVGFVMYALGFRLVATVLATRRRISERLADLGRWSVLDRARLFGVGRWALAVVLTFVAVEGILIALLPRHVLAASAVVVLSLGLLIPALIPWFLLWAPHRLLAQSRQQRRERARLGISMCSHTLGRLTERGRTKRAARVAAVLQSWVAYEGWLAGQAPWPMSLAHAIGFASALAWLAFLFVGRMLAS